MKFLKILGTNIIGILFGIFITVSFISALEGLGSMYSETVHFQAPISSEIRGHGLEEPLCKNAFVYEGGAMDWFGYFATDYPLEAAVKWASKRTNKTVSIGALPSNHRFKYERLVKYKEVWEACMICSLCTY